MASPLQTAVSADRHAGVRPHAPVAGAGANRSAGAAAAADEKALAEPGFYQWQREEFQRATRELADVQLRLEAAFTRWSQLESGD